MKTAGDINFRRLISITDVNKILDTHVVHGKARD